MYRTLELPGKNPLKDAHTYPLDSAVLGAYGFAANDDLLSQLLTLNLEVARRIEAGERCSRTQDTGSVSKPGKSGDCRLHPNGVLDSERQDPI